MYALMMRLELNIGMVLKSAMRKARAHKGRRYVFGGIIIELCIRASVLMEVAMHPILTTAQRSHWDEMIMARMFGLEMLRHTTSHRPST